MSKLRRLLHKEIKQSDTAINGRLDWWVSYLDERLPRGTLALPRHCHRDRRRVQRCWLSRSPLGHCDDVMHQTRPQGDDRARSEHIWRVHKRRINNKKKLPSFPPFIKHIYRLHVCRGIWGHAAHTSCLRFIKTDPREMRQMPSRFLEGLLESFRDRLLIVIPCSSSSKLSLILRRK